MALPALVLTAGLATRLRPLSLLRAKAALPVAGAPLVVRVIRWLVACGTADVVLNLHHLPDTITRVVGDGSQFGVRVRYSWEDPVLGSAGGPRHALPLLASNRFLIVNGDTLTDVDLHAMVSAHDAAGAKVTMALIPNPQPERYGGVLLDGDAVRAFTPRGGATPTFHFIGVQVVESSVFEDLPDNVASEIVRDVYPRLMRESPGSVRAFVSDARFEDIGTPGDYHGTALAVADRETGVEANIGARARIHPRARVARCVLWDDVSVDAGADLTDCIIADGVQVPEGTKLDRSIVMPAAAETLGAAGERRDNLLIAPF